MPKKAHSLSLWEFSVGTYSRPGVAEICLALQDKANADVNVALMMLWLANDGHRVADERFFSLLEAQIGEWHAEVVRALRGARRWMKTCQHPDAVAAQTLRNNIKRLEIEAERLEQQLLEAFATSHSSLLAETENRERAMRSNLEAYLDHLAMFTPQSRAAADKLAALSV